MKTLALAAGLLAALALPAQGGSLTKTYSYFAIGGSTIEEIDRELQRRGPQVRGTGARHPGATRMEFTSRVTYGERNGRCGVVEASVTVNANVILPRWNRPRRADEDTRFVWDTLAADIKRHEESHVVIARNHAREMAQAIRQVRRERSCEIAQQKVEATTARILARHDRAQEEFDRVEAINFESRLLRLMRYRLEQSRTSQR